MFGCPTLVDADREILVQLCKDFTNHDVTLFLRVTGPVAVAPNAFAAGPTQVGGRLIGLKYNDRVVQIRDQKPTVNGPVTVDMYVLISDILKIAVLGEIVLHKRVVQAVS